MKSQFQLGKKKEAEDSEKESNKLEMNTQLAVEVEFSRKLEFKKKRLVKISSFFLFTVARATKKREERKEVNDTREKKN